jgi:L-ascorbate metabolism protein UlaG (beta-lactamase superfamily)
MLKQSTGLILLLIFCSAPSFAQEQTTVDPALTPKQDEMINQQARKMLGQADAVLEEFPPQLPEPLERTLALYLLDCIFHDVYAPQRLPVQQFVQKRMEQMADQMDSTDVEEGAMIWKLYSHSFVVRTPSVTLAFDLIRPSVRFDTFYTDVKPLLSRIIDQCDALFISHWHPDHADHWVARAFIEQDKPVVAPPDVWKDEPIYDQLSHLVRDAEKKQSLSIQNGENTLETVIYPGHQGDYLNNVAVVYTPEGLCFSHNGDQNAGQIEGDTLWLFDIGNHHRIDVLMYNSYMRPAWISGFDPELVISAHENELGHGIHSRHPFWRMHERAETIPYPLLVLAWGESFHYVPEKMNVP